MIVRKNLLKRIIYATTVFAVVLAPTAHSATKPVPIKQFMQLSKDASAEGMAVTSKAVVTYSNIIAKSSDIQLRAVDFSGVQIWSKTIDSGWDEAATAITTDGQGSIWLTGNSAPAALTESATVIAGALNPDSVTVENLPELRGDMKNIVVWQISSSGELLSESVSTQMQPAIVDAISANASGASILLSRDNGQSLISLKAGKFGKELKIGSAKSKFNFIVRSTDGSTSLFGSSSETLGGKKLAGKIDGILMKVSKTGSVTSVVRSSATGAIRDWQSATSSNFLAGVVISGKKIETALTKFSAAFAPTWTTRYPSTGSSLAAAGSNGSVFAIFEPTAALKGVSGWKQVKGQSVTLQFDSKGLLINAFTNSLLSAPIAAGYSAEAGLLVLTANGEILQAVSR